MIEAQQFKNVLLRGAVNEKGQLNTDGKRYGLISSPWQVIFGAQVGSRRIDVSIDG